MIHPVRTLAAALLVVAGASAGAGERPLVSLLALGDTGQDHEETSRDTAQEAVAQALAAEDRRQPAHALVLLGDHFYPDGLAEGEVEKRVRENLVRPYCRFIELQGKLSARVAGACTLPATERRPIPIYAVLGNHDYLRPESPRLQREAVPRYVSNWRMPPQDAEHVDLGHGVSLVLFDSVAVQEGRGGEDLARELRRASGRWLVLAAHHVPARVEGDDFGPAYLEALHKILAVAGRTPQLFLGGHEHNLQLVALARPFPSLAVIAGGGSSARNVRALDPPALAAHERMGFARVDLVDVGDGQRLRATLFALPERGLHRSAEAIARAEVDARGRVTTHSSAR